MLRKDIEFLMKLAKRDHVTLVYHETDPLGMLCYMTGGALCDYTGHRVPAKLNVWGIINYEDGKPVRYPIEDKINEILFCQ